jgi:ATP-dependent phosphofructokinase / diphosphate-dependent phosphofructokinase
MRKINRLGILTGGGDCPGLNAVIRAVVRCAAAQGVDCVGIKDGYWGLVKNATQPLPVEATSGLLTRGGTILGSSNKDDPFAFMEADAKGKVTARDLSDKCVANLRLNGLDALVVLGGDGTMTVSAKFAAKGVKIVGVPKTIDNDLVGTDITFGHDTAVSIASEAIDRLHTTADSPHRAIVVEVMGRYAGWLALNSGLASGGDVILIPEIPFQWEKVAGELLKRKAKGKLSSIIVAGEGAAPKGGKQVVSRINPLSPEKIRLGGIGKVVADEMEKRTGIETRAVVLGHVVRGGTPTAFDRILATRLGTRAAELAVAGKFGGMVAVKNKDLVSVPLALIGGKCRKIAEDEALLLTARKIGVEFGE